MLLPARPTEAVKRTAWLTPCSSMKVTPARTAAHGPLGLARRPRLSDHETEQRMLHTATALIDGSGLTVSLDHISFEEVIQQAGVSRSAAYRRWPYKDLFFSDLLKELAQAARPAAVSGFEASSAAIREIALAHLDWLETPEGRHDLVLELIRLGALNDFETKCLDRRNGAPTSPCMRPS
jgi:AcrR family transcriptional regulator